MRKLMLLMAAINAMMLGAMVLVAFENGGVLPPRPAAENALDTVVAMIFLFSGNVAALLFADRELRA